MSSPTIQVPSSIGTFEVRCAIGHYIIDQSDEDRDPDLMTMGGRVEISMNLTKPLRRISEPMRIISTNSFSCVIDPITGQLVSPDGSVGVRLVDPKDPNLDPKNWNYRAVVYPDKGNPWEVNFTSPELGEDFVDLGKLVSTSPDGGVPTAVPGASAYQIALRHHFVGTEEEWLASLKTPSESIDLDLGPGSLSGAITLYREGRFVIADLSSVAMNGLSRVIASIPANWRPQHRSEVGTLVSDSGSWHYLFCDRDRILSIEAYPSGTTVSGFISWVIS